jgi:hypothetical protein
MKIRLQRGLDGDAKKRGNKCSAAQEGERVKKSRSSAAEGDSTVPVMLDSAVLCGITDHLVLERRQRRNPTILYCTFLQLVGRREV